MVDAELQLPPAGETGELCIIGPASPGLPGRPGLTAEKFLPKPGPARRERVSTTGDLARIDEQG